jgi:hypothetical protein
VFSRSSPPAMKSRATGPRAPRAARLSALLLMGAGAMQFARPARAQSDGEIAAVSSTVSPGYARLRLPDGTFKPETYTFGEGGRLAGSSRDDTVDKLNFTDVASVIADPLKKRNYVPVEDRNPEKTKLLIMVYWGTTQGTADSSDSLGYQNLQRSQVSKPPPTQPPASLAQSGPAANELARQAAATANMRQAAEDGALAQVLAENWQRDQADMRNAMLLGYDTALAETSAVGSTPATLRRDDLIAEVEESRYFVVLMAYDYQALWTQKKHSLLWVTRLSVRERGADFGKLLPSMVGYASQYFGQDSHGLLRRPLPEGHVEIGVPKSLGTVPEK